MAKENPNRLCMPLPVATARIFIVQNVEESRTELPTKSGSQTYRLCRALPRVRGTFVASGRALWRVASPGPSMWAPASRSVILAF